MRNRPSGTAGSVRNAADRFGNDEPFLVISGDALTDFDLTDLVQGHKRRGAALTMALTRVPNPLEYGVINIEETGRVSQFLEKPSWGAGHLRHGQHGHLRDRARSARPHPAAHPS